ncbi:MAG: AAA family ATPase [Candidatus Nanopelagicales bacterium]|jgi:NadR type nicotinamide-nucleotide adenylyltransferase
MSHGLTLGKYAPLHAGHCQVIETALAEMERVTVIIYDCPETTAVPLNLRADWLRDLYPTVNVIEAWDGPVEVGNTPEIQRRHETYVRDVLRISDVTHFYSSEFYGDHMSRALGAVNRLVDPDRVRTPVSGTLIRADPYHWRDYVPARVYRDLIVNVVFLGAPSTGKTTLAEALARELDTVWMPEYGREYWEAHQRDRRLSPDQLVELAEGHLAREEALLQEANGVLFTDTNALTTYVFGGYYHGCVAPRLALLAATAERRYDLVFVCNTDIPYDDTWDRSGQANRDVFQKRIVADLHRRRVPYLLLSGELEKRIEHVKGVLAVYQKYSHHTANIVAAQTVLAGG